jgi:hypothetical protein
MKRQTKGRIKRPHLPRSEPERSFSGLFSDGQAKRRAAGKPAAGAPRDGAAPDDDRSPGISEGVTTGYEVIEDYIRQGQEFARELWRSAPTAAAGARRNVAERMVRSASDLASLFSELLQTVTLPANRPSPGSAAIPDFGLPNGGSNGARHAEPAAPPIWIDLQSRRPVEISVDLRPSPGKRSFVAHDLRATSPSLPRVAGPRIETQADRLVVRVRVPDRQPPGVYSGLIIDEKTNLPCGSLTLQVRRDRGP